MTTNLQQLNHSFQYAESGLVRGLKAPDRLDTGDTGDIYPGDYDAPDMWMCYDSDDPAIAADCIDSSSNGNAAVITRYRGRGNLPPQNYSLESGFATHYFFVGSEGTANQSISTHNVGISLVGPSGVQ